jgi:hypothetical protein
MINITARLKHPKGADEVARELHSVDAKAMHSYVFMVLSHY